MPIVQRQDYCPECERNRLFTATTPSHVIHLLLTFLTCGFWLPIWLLISLLNPPVYLCSKCGSKAPKAPFWKTVGSVLMWTAIWLVGLLAALVVFGILSSRK